MAPAEHAEVTAVIISNHIHWLLPFQTPEISEIVLLYEIVQYSINNKEIVTFQGKKCGIFQKYVRLNIDIFSFYNVLLCFCCQLGRLKLYARC